MPIAVAGENQWSWQLRIGADRIKDTGEDRYDGIGSFGIGRAWKANGNIAYYGMVDFAGHTISPYVRLRPHLGFKFDGGGCRAWLYIGAGSTGYGGKFREIWGGKIQYQLSNRIAIHIEVSNERATRTLVGLNWYW